MPRISCKPFTDVAVKKLQPGATLADSGDHKGLRANRTKTVTTRCLYRYRSPTADQPLWQMMLGSYPHRTRADARAELQVIKVKCKSGICPVTGRRAAEAARRREAERVASEAALSEFLAADMVAACELH